MTTPDIIPKTHNLSTVTNEDMIPVKLVISGFLSYRSPVELDFTAFDLACIAGPNGAGKSSLLDAMTYALFGQGRKRDESLIHTNCDSAEVTFTFAYEGDLYRVQRVNARGKSTVLEFHLQTPDGSWKPLTERTLRETDARIQEVLRMDYETFVNASFFLQGKADQFTQQRPGDRKRILGSILGLEVWERYRQRAAARRRDVQGEIDTLDGRLQEIEAELIEEDERVANLSRLEADLGRATQARANQEANLDAVRQIAATLTEQRKLVQALARQRDSAARALGNLEDRLDSRLEERRTYNQIVSRSEEIEAAYQEWERAREELVRWEEIAGRFREGEKRRAEPLTEIKTARARLETEQEGLLVEQAALDSAVEESLRLEEKLKGAHSGRAEMEARLERRKELMEALETARQRQAEARAENPRLKAAMNELKERIDQLTRAEGVECPLCGQPLSPEERESLIEDLNEQGESMGERYRANQALMKTADDQVRELNEEIRSLAKSEADLREIDRQINQIESRLDAIHSQEGRWQEKSAPRLLEIQRALKEETFAPEARARLAEIDTELKAIGYDAAQHDAIRRAEQAGREAEGELRALENARAALAPIERQIQELEAEIADQREAVRRQKEEYEAAADSLAASEEQAPDLAEAESELLHLQQEENRLRMEVGAAQQKVLVLDDLKARQEAIQDERASLARKVGQYRQLERAFGKDGVPALLIEQALPQIETSANEILDRLSAGGMSVRFVTQAEYKDKSRSDLRETLDIEIQDSAGRRDYDLFSGGEAFRVNFAIRLALSEVLARRAGARLQTLVIDEGFGSQDAVGRQRLIEAINLVRADFEKILVITHIEALKDAFPVRIEVEKTPIGSQIQVA
jgi:exonuclease SbcC